MSRRWLLPPFILLILLSVISLAAAQPATGIISGTVVDRYGKPLKKAAVRASNLDDGLTVESLTDRKGTFRMDQMSAGTYEVQASLGRHGVLSRKVKLQAGQTVSVDFIFNIEEPRSIDPAYRPSPPSMI